MRLPYHLLGGRPELEEVSRRHATGVYYGEHRLLGDFLAFVDTRDLMLGPSLVLDGKQPGSTLPVGAPSDQRHAVRSSEDFSK
jgi:hypothetical protein